MNNIGFVVCAGVLGFFGLLFGFILLMRYLDYRETLKLAEKGLLHPGSPLAAGRAGGSRLLVWGILVAAVGLALTIGLYPMGLHRRVPGNPLGLGPWILAGLLPLFIGLAFILIHLVSAGSRRGGKSEAPAGERGLPPVEPLTPLQEEVPKPAPVAPVEEVAPQAKGRKRA